MINPLELSPPSLSKLPPVIKIRILLVRKAEMSTAIGVAPAFGIKSEAESGSPGNPDAPARIP